jgi:hypothetical protein
MTTLKTPQSPITRAWRAERALVARWPERLQARYLAAIDRFDPPIPDEERRRLEAATRRRLD